MRSVTSSPPMHSLSLSPTFPLADLRRPGMQVRPSKVLHPVQKGEIRLLILENISQEAVEAFEAEGFRVDYYKGSLGEDELVEKIGQYHGIGIRSKTKITERVIKAASKVNVIVQTLRHREAHRAVTASCHWLFLHRDQSSRYRSCCEGRHSRLQFSFLQF